MGKREKKQDDMKNLQKADDAKEGIKRNYRRPQLKNGIFVSKSVFLSDATGSMGSTWRNTKKYINTIIDRSYKIAGHGAIYIKWCAYRDYSEGSKILECMSSFSSNKRSVQNFVNRIRVYGGGDWPEAVSNGMASVKPSSGAT